MSGKILLFICTSFFFFAAVVYSQTNLNPENPPEVKIAGTQLMKIHSSITGRDYDLYVNLPRGYDDTSKTFPVVFVLDGQWDFPLVESIYGQQYYDGFVPSLVVVGITWGGKNPNYDSLRALDLTPTSIGQPSRFGAAPKFLQFIKDELIPFVQSHYRVDKNGRTLMGSSLGGLFTLYTLFNDTNLFDRYICTSPAVTWDNGVVFKYEKDYAEKNSKLPVKLFMAIGGYEPQMPFDKIVGAVKDAKFEGLDFQTKVIEGVGHSGGKSDGFTRGMQFVFKRTPVAVAPEVLQQYAGNYEAGPGFVIKLAVEDSNLVAYIPGEIKETLHASSDKDFYIIGAYANVHFKKDENGKVTGFELEQYAGKSFIKKAD